LQEEKIAGEWVGGRERVALLQITVSIYSAVTLAGVAIIGHVSVVLIISDL
jgi:hypothetical protein